jgi:hypothetical protein
VIHTNLLMAGATTGLMNLLAIAVRTELWAGGMVGSHWHAASLLVTFPLGLLCLRKLSHRIASAKWS